MMALRPGQGPWSSIYIDPEYMSGPYWDARATTERKIQQPEWSRSMKIDTGWVPFDQPEPVDPFFRQRWLSKYYQPRGLRIRNDPPRLLSSICQGCEVLLGTPLYGAHLRNFHWKVKE